MEEGGQLGRLGRVRVIEDAGVEVEGGGPVECEDLFQGPDLLVGRVVGLRGAARYVVALRLDPVSRYCDYDLGVAVVVGEDHCGESFKHRQGRVESHPVGGPADGCGGVGDLDGVLAFLPDYCHSYCGVGREALGKEREADGGWAFLAGVLYRGLEMVAVDVLVAFHLGLVEVLQDPGVPGLLVGLVPLGPGGVLDGGGVLGRLVP